MLRQLRTAVSSSRPALAAQVGKAVSKRQARNRYGFLTRAAPELACVPSLLMALAGDAGSFPHRWPGLGAAIDKLENRCESWLRVHQKQEWAQGAHEWQLWTDAALQGSARAGHKFIQPKQAPVLLHPADAPVVALQWQHKKWKAFWEECYEEDRGGNLIGPSSRGFPCLLNNSGVQPRVSRSTPQPFVAGTLANLPASLMKPWSAWGCCWLNARRVVCGPKTNRT